MFTSKKCDFSPIEFINQCSIEEILTPSLNLIIFRDDGEKNQIRKPEITVFEFYRGSENRFYSY